MKVIFFRLSKLDNAGNISLSQLRRIREGYSENTEKHI